MLAVLVSLGNWQINRSREKQQLLDGYQSAPRQPQVTIQQLQDGWTKYQFRKTSMHGQYLAGRQILLENQIRDGRPGYMVLTPFSPDGQDFLVLVNRGWIASGGNRQQLPDIGITVPVAVVRGMVSHLPGVGIRMGSLDDAAGGWPKAVPYIDREWLQLQTGKPVTPWMLLLDGDEPDGYVRDWRPALKMGPEKHRGYAFTWFSLAAALVFLFVIASFKPEGKANRE